MTILQTDRLLIEEATDEDADFFYRLLNSSNWLEYIGNRGIHTIADATSYIENSLVQSYSSLGYGLYKMVLKKEKEPIGICGFLRRDYLDHPDIGFAVLPEFERNGYTWEAAEAMKSYGYAQLGFGSILAITSKENISSQNLLNKLGLRYAGNVQPPESDADLLLYSDSV